MLEQYLKKNFLFRKNLVSGRIEFKQKTKNGPYQILEEEDFNSILRRLRKRGINAGVQDLRITLNSDFPKRYDPFKDYLGNLPRFDGKADYIKQLALTITTSDDDYFYWIFKKWITAMIGCAVSDRVINHCVLIICGRQNLGKTTWFRNLIPQCMKPYFYEGSINPKDKDSLILVSQKMLIMMDELASINKNNNECFKELITKDQTTLRPPYAIFSNIYPRRCSFAGTSNHTEILSDPTGNRRYLCIEAFKIQAIHNVDLNMVYAQALHLFKDPDFRYYLNDEDLELVSKKNRYFTQESEEMRWLEEFFVLPEQGKPAIRLSATEVCEFIRKRKRVSRHISPVLIGKHLSELGYTKRGKHRKYELIEKEIIING